MVFSSTGLSLCGVYLLRLITIRQRSEGYFMMLVLTPESHAYASQIETHEFGAVTCDSYIHTTYL